ncbi:hypothetical protein ACHAXR_010999, partial [Thalassiosira sp. AJA248-18]
AGLRFRKKGSSIEVKRTVDRLRVLNLSSNVLSQSIPVELGRLEDAIEILDLTNSKLEGTIPPQLGDLSKRAKVHLSGNSGLALSNRKERAKGLFESAKGQEWTKSDGWLNEFDSHCDWYGVIECDENNNTIKLNLRSNGLSGTLSKDISDLTLLQELDLSDNDIKGSIPTEIGLLSHLTYLRLSYNSFVGDRINFGSLQQLKLLQLHGNRISGSIPLLNLSFVDRSSFVSDCGNPSDFEQSLATPKEIVTQRKKT